MRYGITGLIATAYTLDKIDQRNGIKTGQTYMGSLPWGKIAFCAGLDIMKVSCTSSSLCSGRGKISSKSECHFVGCRR